MTRRFGESVSKFLKGSDLLDSSGRKHRELDVAIDCVTEEQVGEEKEEKFILYFRGKSKGMALNVTNETLLIDLFGHPEDGTPEGLTDHLTGKLVHLYFDPTVQYAGKRVGGLRLARAKGGAVAGGEPPAQPEPPAPEENPASAPGPAEDIPF